MFEEPKVHAGPAADAEEANNQRLMALVGCIHGIVLELDGDARYLNLWADDPALLAVPREQAIGRTIDEVLGPQVGPPFTALVKRVFASGITEHLEYPLPTDGALRWFFADVKRVPAGNTFTVVLFARDISERKRGEEALRQSEERYRLAAQATNDVLYDHDVARDQVTWGPSAAALFLETDVGTTARWWKDRIHAADAGRVVTSLEAFMAGEEASWSSRYRLRRGDGTSADVLDRAFAVRQDGRPVRLVGSIADVTHVNRLQAQLVQADRLAAIGLLAAGVGHEINNPLSSVLGNVEYALELGPFAESPAGRAREEDVRAALRDAHEGATRIAESVRSLRLFSRSDAADQAEVDIEEVIERSIKMAENEIRHRARLVRSFEPLPRMTVSASCLGQVCLNLLVNAAQAIEDGHRESNEIRVATRRDGRGRVLLSVSDTGPGIRPEHIERVFDPFFTTKPLGVGSSIGLSVCFGLVQSMGGELTVSSDPDQPTTFTVALPVAASRPASVAAAAPIGHLPQAEGKRRLLVIDDDDAVGRYVTRVLRKECDVTAVSSSRSALRRLASGETFDLILCDVMMPDMNGVELYDVLRKEHRALLPRLVFMTGGAFTASAARFLESLPQPALDKPMDAEKLRSILRSVR